MKNIRVILCIITNITMSLCVVIKNNTQCHGLFVVVKNISAMVCVL